MDGLADVMDDNKKWGVINKDGKTIIPFLYSNPFFKLEHKILIFNENGKIIFMNRHGDTIRPNQLKNMAVFHEGLVTIVDEHEHYGFADENGEIIFPPKWDYALYFDKGYAYVREIDKCFYMDHSGHLVQIHYELPPSLTTKNTSDFLQCLVIKSKFPVSSIK